MLFICSGYMAPEYAIYGQFSVKSDAYSFGVLVLEILSGRKSTTYLSQTSNAEDLRSYVSIDRNSGIVALELILESFTPN